MSSKLVLVWPWDVWSGSPGTWTGPYQAVGSPVSRLTSWPAPAPLDPCHWQHPKEPGSPLIRQKHTYNLMNFQQWDETQKQQSTIHTQYAPDLKLWGKYVYCLYTKQNTSL